VKDLKTRKLIFVTLVSLFFAFYCFSPELFPLSKVDLEQEYSELFTIADKLRKEGKFNKSIELFQKSLSIAKRVSNKEKEFESLLKLGLLNWNIGQLKESCVHYERAFRLAQELNQKDFQGKCQNPLKISTLYLEGRRLRSHGEFQKSKESFKRALELAKEIRSIEHD
jgi:tetratricopeptide (TPR) repeat protein